MDKHNDKKEIIIKSPLNGRLIPMEQVNDPTFSQKILGDGVAVIPVKKGLFSKNILYSPIDGKIASLFPTLHALVITNNTGLELLLHVGINSVTLEGKGLTALVREGDNVKAGDKLIEMNLKAFEQAGIDPVTPIIILNTDAITSLDYFEKENVIAGQDTIMKVYL